MQTTISAKHPRLDRHMVLAAATGIVAILAFATVAVMLIRDDAASAPAARTRVTIAQESGSHRFIEENTYLPDDTGSAAVTSSIGGDYAFIKQNVLVPSDTGSAAVTTQRGVEHAFIEQNLYLPDGGSVSTAGGVTDHLFMEQNLYLPDGHPAMLPPFGEGPEH